MKPDPRQKLLAEIATLERDLEDYRRKAADQPAAAHYRRVVEMGELKLADLRRKQERAANG